MTLHSVMAVTLHHISHSGRFGSQLH